MNERVLILALTLAAPLAAHADPAPTLTLQEARRLAVENHPRLQAQRFNGEAALQSIAAARSAWLPQVSGFADRVFAGNDTRIAATGGLTNPTVIDHGSTGLAIGQLITDFGRTDDQIDQATLEAKAETERTAQTEESVLLDVTRAYYEVLRAQSMLRVARKNLDDRSTLLKRVEAMEQAKLRSKLDVDIARQVVDKANLLILSATGDQDAAKAHLAVALGMATVGDFVLAEDAEAAAPPPSAEDLVTEMEQRSPELAAEKAAREAARKGADVAGDAWLPTIAAVGALGYSPIDDPTQKLRDSYAAAGITISVPIFTGGLLEADTAKAEAQANAAERAVVDTRNRLAGEVRSAYATVKTAYDGIAVTDHLVATTRQSLRLMQAGFDLGRNSIVDLDQAELQATEAEIAHADARYAYLSKLSTLEYVVGRLSVLSDQP